MTDLELIAIFAASWIVAAAIWMLVDWAARPKHARFRAKGDRVQRGPLQYRHYRKVRRSEENEEIRLRLTERTGQPTLAVRGKRRERVLARHDQPTPAPALNHSEKLPVSDEDFWIDLRDSSFDDANKQRLANGQPPVRYNPLADEEEQMLRTEADTAVWPDGPVDPFAGQALARTDDHKDEHEVRADEDLADEDLADDDHADETDAVDTDDTDDASSDQADEAAEADGEQVAERVVRNLKSLPEAG